MPVNLSLGPAPEDRSFDPSNNFDTWALKIIPEEYHYIFVDINKALADSDNNKIAQGLAILPVVSAPWPMTLGDDANWIRAYDDLGRIKYCPKVVFDSVVTGFCPISD